MTCSHWRTCRHAGCREARRLEREHAATSGDHYGYREGTHVGGPLWTIECPACELDAERRGDRIAG